MKTFAEKEKAIRDLLETFPFDDIDNPPTNQLADGIREILDAELEPGEITPPNGLYFYDPEEWEYTTEDLFLLTDNAERDKVLQLAVVEEYDANIFAIYDPLKEEWRYFNDQDLADATLKEWLDALCPECGAGRLTCPSMPGTGGQVAIAICPDCGWRSDGK